MLSKNSKIQHRQSLPNAKVEFVYLSQRPKTFCEPVNSVKSIVNIFEEINQETIPLSNCSSKCDLSKAETMDRSSNLVQQRIQSFNSLAKETEEKRKNESIVIRSNSCKTKPIEKINFLRSKSYKYDTLAKFDRPTLPVKPPIIPHNDKTSYKNCSYLNETFYQKLNQKNPKPDCTNLPNSDKNPFKQYIANNDEVFSNFPNSKDKCFVKNTTIDEDAVPSLKNSQEITRLDTSSGEKIRRYKKWKSIEIKPTDGPENIPFVNTIQEDKAAQLNTARQRKYRRKSVKSDSVFDETKIDDYLKIDNIEEKYNELIERAERRLERLRSRESLSDKKENIDLTDFKYKSTDSFYEIDFESRISNLRKCSDTDSTFSEEIPILEDTNNNIQSDNIINETKLKDIDICCQRKENFTDSAYYSGNNVLDIVNETNQELTHTETKEIEDIIQNLQLNDDEIVQGVHIIITDTDDNPENNSVKEIKKLSLEKEEIDNIIQNLNLDDDEIVQSVQVIISDEEEENIPENKPLSESKNYKRSFSEGAKSRPYSCDLTFLRSSSTPVKLTEEETKIVKIPNIEGLDQSNIKVYEVEYTPKETKEDIDDYRLEGTIEAQCEEDEDETESEQADYEQSESELPEFKINLGLQQYDSENESEDEKSLQPIETINPIYLDDDSSSDSSTELVYEPAQRKIEEKKTIRYSKEIKDGVFSYVLFDGRNNPIIKTESIEDLDKLSENEELKNLISKKPKRENVYEEICVPRDNSQCLAIISELLETEKSYIFKSLRTVVMEYMPMLYKNCPPELIGKQKVIFGNIKEICNSHRKRFYPALGKSENILEIAKCFLQHKDVFSLYTDYYRNKPNSDRMIKKYSYFFEKKQVELQDPFDLASYLLTPVQRLTKYGPLLSRLKKECDKDGQVIPELDEAMAMIESEIRRGNDMLVFDSIIGKFELKDQGRLVLRDEFEVWTVNRKTCFRAMVFLFEKNFLITTINSKDQYVVTDMISMEELGYTHVQYDPFEFKIWFRKHDQKVYTLRTKHEDTKKKWTKTINDELWKQLMESKKRKCTHDIHYQEIQNNMPRPMSEANCSETEKPINTLGSSLSLNKNHGSQNQNRSQWYSNLKMGSDKSFK